MLLGFKRRFAPFVEEGYQAGSTAKPPHRARSATVGAGPKLYTSTFSERRNRSCRFQD